MSLVSNKIKLSLASILAAMSFQLAAVSITPQMMQQFQNLPRAEQERLAKQYGIDPSQLRGGQSTNRGNDFQEQPQLVQPRDDKERKDKDKDDEDSEVRSFLKEKENKPLKRFGYEMFAGEPTTFAPMSDVPVPSNYMVGPGDTVKVQLYGKENSQYDLTVTRDGVLQFPDLGPVNVNGLTFSEVREVLGKQIKQQMIGVDSNITMGELRSIRIFVAGDAYKPGSYTVSSLSTITQALFVSGGVSEIGSLRNIQLKRQGKIIATFDLYDLLLKGDSSNDLPLRSGDVVFIPAVGPSIHVDGDVQRPAIYELKPHETMAQVVTMAAGFKPGAYPKSSTVERFNSAGLKSIVSVDLTSAAGQGIQAKDGDFLRVKSASNEYDNAVTVVGAAVRPGVYQWTQGQRVNNLLPSLSADLLTGADLNYALIVREINELGDIQVLQFSPASAITNPSSKDNLLLKPKDKLVVFNETDNARSRYQLNQLIKKRIYHIQKANNEFFEELNVDADGNNLNQQNTQSTRDSRNSANAKDNPLSSLVNGDLFKSGFAQLEQTKMKKRTQLAGVVVGDIEEPEDSDVISSEVEKMLSQLFNDKGLIKLSAELNRQELLYPIITKLKAQGRAGAETQVVAVHGEVRYAGIYPLTAHADINSLIAAAGGLKEGAYTQRAELTRTVTDRDSSSITHINISVQKALELDQAANISLQPRDVLTVMRTPEWQETQTVEVRGEVKFPGIYSIRRGETLEQVIQRAGGFTDHAYLPSAVFVRDSIKKQEQIEIEKFADQLRRDLASRGVSKEDTVTNYEDAQKMLDDLESIKAVGRLVIDLPAISLGIKEADLQLENKDVLYVPALKQTISVVGEVQHPSTHRYKTGMSMNQYLDMAGGARKRADEDRIYVIKADGSVMLPHHSSWFSTSDELQPGDTIVVPLDTEYKDRLTLWSQVTSIFYNSAVAIAALASF